MSLSEQIQRVDGSQNDILRALAQSYGIKTSGLKIDQLAAAVKASQKFKQDGLLSTATAGLFGLGANSTPDDAFKKINTSLNALQSDVKSKVRIVEGSYTGTNEKEKTITFDGEPVVVFFTSKDVLSEKWTETSVFIKGQEVCGFYNQPTLVSGNREEYNSGAASITAVWGSNKLEMSWGNPPYGGLNTNGRLYKYWAIVL